MIDDIRVGDTVKDNQGCIWDVKGLTWDCLVIDARGDHLKNTIYKSSIVARMGLRPKRFCPHDFVYWGNPIATEPVQVGPQVGDDALCSWCHRRGKIVEIGKDGRGFNFKDDSPLNTPFQHDTKNIVFWIGNRAC